MRKGQIVKWDNNISNNKNGFERFISVLMNMLLSVICVFICLYSSCVLLSDGYKWGSIDNRDMMNMLLYLIPVVVVMELTYLFKGWIGCIIRWAILAIIIICAVFYFKDAENLERIVSGLQRIASYYVETWNEYYKTSFGFVAGNITHVSEALKFIMFAIFVVMLWLAGFFKKNVLLVTVPLCILGLQHLEGISPDNVGVILIFVAILISNTLEWKNYNVHNISVKKYISQGLVRIITWIMVVVCIFAFCVIIKSAGTTQANEMLKYSDDMKKLQNDVVKKVAGVDYYAMLFGGADDSKEEKLTNDSPKYEYTPVLDFRINSKPLGNIYLKGFYADRYENGVWTPDLDTFDKACTKKGEFTAAVSERIADMSYRMLREKYSNSVSSKRLNETTASIAYYNTYGKMAYFPYFSEVENEGVSVEGDYRHKKKSGVGNLSVRVFNYNSDYSKWISDAEPIIEESVDALYDSVYSSFYPEEEVNLEMLDIVRGEEWYREYVMRNYVDVPDNITEASVVASEIALEDKTPDYNNIEDDNGFRMYYAGRVARWLHKNTAYSLVLPKVTKGADPIDYFLGNSKRGYCMHYASAATMILRELGIPARYASGYVIKKKSLEKCDNGYEATVMDNDAHAWVEIYLDGIGWVPVEVTKGYSEIDDSQDENETPTPKPDTNQDKENVSKDNNKVNVKKEAPKKEIKWNVKHSVIVGCIVLVVVIAVILLIYVISGRKKHEQLLKIIRRKKTSQAIKTINRRLYRKLRFSGKIIKSNINDEVYETILKKTYSDISPKEWERYMEIVKAATFSLREFSIEEMEFCYGIYQRVVKLQKEGLSGNTDF